MNDTIAGQAYRVVIEERIHDLLVTRRWYRTHRWADWPDLRKEAEIELRALLKVARKARRIVAARPDPMDQAKRQTPDPAYEGRLGYHDWQAAYPEEDPAWTNREGQPEFNGAFR